MIEENWRSIILFGKNVASYKFALAKTLLELDTSDPFISLEDLALPYAKNIASHLANCKKQITNPNGSRFLTLCENYSNELIDDDELRAVTAKTAFGDVIPRFHNVAGQTSIDFYEDLSKSKKGIMLTDNFYQLLQSSQHENFLHEAESRWRLWEEAILSNLSQHFIIQYDQITDELYHQRIDKPRRENITSAKPALNGYQEGKCFYCNEEIILDAKRKEVGACEVDHFFAWDFYKRTFYGDIETSLGKEVDRIWNLVLACERCNRQKSSNLPNKDQNSKFPNYLKKLHDKNNALIRSPLPLKESIMQDTGLTETDRVSFLDRTYNKLFSIKPYPWEPKLMQE
jgi:5-methylcytosine-specific restriction endonuclease McrA